MEINTTGKDHFNKLPLASAKSSKDKNMNRAQPSGDIKKRDKKKEFVKLLHSAQSKNK